MAKEYVSWRQKLLDPRWQKKRLEIMQRAGFRCESCGDGSKTLHIHHGFYEGRDPWEYPDWSLWCLCGECHELVQGLAHDINVELAKLSPNRLEFLFDAIRLADWNELPVGPIRIASVAKGVS